MIEIHLLEHFLQHHGALEHHDIYKVASSYESTIDVAVEVTSSTDLQCRQYIPVL